ncbi:hypothetical protein HDU98_011520 [Podochytrium sp. JEL0797]|nr:hypothetical protein HDU98_011520 [Podochytrium sp. JEL0797]
MAFPTIAELAALHPTTVPLDVFRGMKKRGLKRTSDDAAAEEEEVAIETITIDESEPVTGAATPEEEVVVAEPVVVAPVVAEEPNMFDEFASLKKKKKKAVVIVEDENAEPKEPAAEAEFDFGDKKKKKKKRPDLAEFEEMLRVEKDANADPADQLLNDENDDHNDHEAQPADGDAWLASDREYSYAELLARVFKIIRMNNPELSGEKKKYTLVPPQVVREGTKKSAFVNVVDIARRMRREPDHLIQYLFSELGTSGSIDGAQRLVMKGRFQQKHIENVLKRYIVEYVTCKTCRSGDTILTKENRLFFLQCQSCGSTKSVSAIKTGFMAQTTKRSVARNAAA